MSDGTKVRKVRTPRTLAERREAIRKAEAGLAWDAAKDVFSKSDVLQNLAEGRGRISKIARECESFNSPERIEEMRSRLMERLASLDARAAIARDAAPRFAAALKSIDNVFITVGKAVMESEDAETEINVPSIIDNLFPNGGLGDLLEITGDNSDPFAAFRRKASPGDPDAMPDDSDDDLPTEENSSAE